MTDPARTEELILFLGVGEFAAARLPTATQQAALGGFAWLDNSKPGAVANER